eukprot:651379_1
MAPLFLFIFGLLLLWNIHGEVSTYLVSPTHPSDAVSIKLYNTNSKITIDTDPPSWTIQNPSKPYSWPFHLKLSPRVFTFSDESCSLNITIHGRIQSTNARIFYVFSIGSSFISFAHDFDGNLIINGKKGIFIYPECYSSLATVPQNTKIGTIYNGVRGSKSLRQKLSQTQIDATSTQWYQVSTDTNTHTFPIHFVLKNNAKDGTSTFRFYNEDNIDIECEYDTAFPVHQPFNLFMSTDISSKTAHNEIFKMSQVVIQHDCTAQQTQPNCEFQNRVKHLEWIDEDRIADPIPYHKKSIHINKEHLSVDIDIDVAYLGYSMYNDDEYGTTYSLDFNPFDGSRDTITEPGTCSNRLSSVYWEKEWYQYWQYNAASNDISHLDRYLSYPQPTKLWTLHSKKPCGPISYHGHFEWNDLLQCTDYSGNVCSGLSMIITQKWINFTGTLFIDIISSALKKENRRYFVYHLDTVDFVLPIRKSVGMKSLIKYHLNLFTVTISAVYKYKERMSSGYKLILLTESADFIVLKDAELIAYPRESVRSIEYLESAISGKHCINREALVCSQLWEISIDDVSCPPVDLSGVYGLQFNWSCNALADAGDREYCNKQMSVGGAKVSLSSHLTWMDGICDPRLWMVQFDGRFTLCGDITFSSDCEVFGAGVDRVFVMLEVKQPLDDYIVSDIALTNVWICSIDEDKYGTLSVSQLRAIGGCLSPNIDSNGPFHIIWNEHLSFHAKHIISIAAADDNVIRFSFVTPKSIKRSKLFIHTQVTVTLSKGSNRQNQIRHFGTSIRINPVNSNDYIRNNWKMKVYNYQMQMIALIIAVVVCVICINVLLLQRNKHNNKYYQSQTELYDTETTAANVNQSNKRLYDMIHGLYTSQDEQQQHKHKRKKKKKEKEIPTIEAKKEVELKEKEPIHEESKTELESDTNRIKLPPRFKSPFRKNDTDFTTDIQTLDELTTSCTEFSDVVVDAKKNEAKQAQIIMINAEDEKEKEKEEEQEINEETKYTYASETEQEKRQRVKLIKQMIEDTEIEDTEYTQYSQYSDEYDHDEDD